MKKATTFMGRVKDDLAAQNPTGRTAQVRAVERAASALAPDDRAQRFATRNAMRAELGLGEEVRRRGGLAGAQDKGFLLPAAAMLLGPAALTLAGGAGGTAAGSAASGAAGGMAPVPAVGGGGMLGTIGAGLDKASDWLNSPAGQTLTGLASAGYGIAQGNRANDLTNRAVAADQARWKAGQPLRDAGMAGMLQPVPANASASLGAVGRRGNPFAPVPAMGG